MRTGDPNRATIMAQTRLKNMARSGAWCLFLWAKNLGMSRSSDAWNSDRATPMMAFNTDSSRAKMSGMPIRYLTQPALPKMWSAKLVYSGQRIGGLERRPQHGHEHDGGGRRR